MKYLNLFLKYFRTIKYLKVKQIFYRLKYKIVIIKKVPDTTPILKIENWQWSGPEFFKPGFLNANDVFFLNKKGKILSKKDWNNTEQDKLWLYNLHYFNDLNSQDSHKKINLHHDILKRWIKENPLHCRGNGWESYTISLRLINIVKWYRRSNIDDPEIINSIYYQAMVLNKQLEYHILGNHLFSNAKALIFVGFFLEGNVGDKFLNIGLNILKSELSEQTLRDGGHFELSPMYHILYTIDLLDLINLLQTFPRKISNSFEIKLELCEYVERSLKWLKTMVHPDNDISFFNDSTFGIAPSPKEVFEYASQLGVNIEINYPLKSFETLPYSGFSRISMPRHTLFFDHANIGPDYLTGHSHADNLSLEWSIGEQRILVNSGISVYEKSSERLRQRKTLAHNTVEVDGVDSSEVWSSFRVARRAYSKLNFVDVKDNFVAIDASHNGYLRLRGKVIHSRHIVSTPNQIEVLDRLKGNFKDATIYYHFHPDLIVEQLSQMKVSISLPDHSIVIMESNDRIVLKTSSWHPSFGVKIDNTVCMINITGFEATTYFKIR